MATIVIRCNCGKDMTVVDTISRMGGNQFDQYPVATYTLYKCSCGQTHWEKK